MPLTDSNDPEKVGKFSEYYSKQKRYSINAELFVDTRLNEVHNHEQPLKGKINELIKKNLNLKKLFQNAESEIIQMTREIDKKQEHFETQLRADFELELEELKKKHDLEVDYLKTELETCYQYEIDLEQELDQEMNELQLQKRIEINDLRKDNEFLRNHLTKKRVEIVKTENSYSNENFIRIKKKSLELEELTLKIKELDIQEKNLISENELDSTNLIKKTNEVIDLHKKIDTLKNSNDQYKEKIDALSEVITPINAENKILNGEILLKKKSIEVEKLNVTKRHHNLMSAKKKYQFKKDQLSNLKQTIQLKNTKNQDILYKIHEIALCCADSESMQKDQNSSRKAENDLQKYLANMSKIIRENQKFNKPNPMNLMSLKKFIIISMKRLNDQYNTSADKCFRNSFDNQISSDLARIHSLERKTQLPNKFKSYKLYGRFIRNIQTRERNRNDDSAEDILKSHSEVSRFYMQLIDDVLFSTKIIKK